MRYVQKIVGSRDTAEDVVQEAFLRAYKAYGGYQERGREWRWLRTIARNVALWHLSRDHTSRDVYVDALDGEHPLVAVVDGEPTPEQRAIARERSRRIMAAIDKLPDAQRTVVYYRFVEGMSVHHVAALTGQPAGSVKSKSHYGIQKVRRYLARDLVEEGFTVNCKSAYAHLFQYAKGQIMPEDKDGIERHISVCDSCKQIADALTVLAPHIGPAGEREMRHVLIAIPLDERHSLVYIELTCDIADHEHLNALLNEHDGVLPPGAAWFEACHDAGLEHVAEFDNKGAPVEFELVPNPDERDNVRVRYRRMTRVYPRHTMASVGLGGSSIEPSPHAPNLMLGRMINMLGNDAKSGLYLALPAAAHNIRIKRGNGVIDAGAYTFAFAERYVADDESIRLECTYLKD